VAGSTVVEKSTYHPKFKSSIPDTVSKGGRNGNKTIIRGLLNLQTILESKKSNFALILAIYSCTVVQQSTHNPKFMFQNQLPLAPERGNRKNIY
jgi:hypothetical protein